MPRWAPAWASAAPKVPSAPRAAAGKRYASPSGSASAKHRWSRPTSRSKPSSVRNRLRLMSAMASASSRNAAASAPLAVMRNANVRRSRLLRSQRTCSRPSSSATAPSSCARSMRRIAAASAAVAPSSRCAAKARHALSTSVMSPRARAVRVRSRYSRCNSTRRSTEKVMGESPRHRGQRMWKQEERARAPAPVSKAHRRHRPSTWERIGRKGAAAAAWRHWLAVDLPRLEGIGGGRDLALDGLLRTGAQAQPTFRALPGVEAVRERAVFRCQRYGPGGAHPSAGAAPGAARLVHPLHGPQIGAAVRPVRRVMPTFLKLEPPADGMALHRPFGKPVAPGDITGLVALGRHAAEERPGRGARCGSIGRPFPAWLFRPDSAATAIPASRILPIRSASSAPTGPLSGKTIPPLSTRLPSRCQSPRSARARSIFPRSTGPTVR